MLNLKRLLSVLSVLLCLSLSVFSQEQPSTINTNIQSPWNVIDNSLMSLENEMNNMNLFINQQEEQIKTLEKAYQDVNILYLNSETRCSSLENDIQKWKTCSIVLGTTTITLTVVVIAVPVILKYIK